MALSNNGRIRVNVTGARGALGIDLQGTPTPGQFLVKAPGGGRTFNTASGTGADNGLRKDLAASDGSANVGVQQSGVGAVTRSVEDELRDAVCVKQFGATSGNLGDPAANASAFKLAINEAMRRKVPLNLAGETYRLDASNEPSGGVNFGRAGLVVLGGGATLKYEGSGRAFVIDPDPTNTFFGTTLYGICVSDLLIVGGPAVTDGFYARGFCHGHLRRIEVREVSQKAYHLKHAVSSLFDNIRYSTNSTPGQPAQVTTPQHGLYLDNNNGIDPGGIPRNGYYSADNTFNNLVVEGFKGTGVEMADAQGNLFNCGTSEANDRGVVIRGPSINNHFNTFWSEQNRITDIEDAGDDTTYVGVRMISNQPSQNVILTGDGATFIGGRLRSVQFSGGPRNASFFGVSLSSNASLGFLGTASYTRVNCKKFDTVGNIVGAFSDIFNGGRGTAQITLSASGGGTIALNPNFDSLFWTIYANRVEYSGLLVVSSVVGPLTGELRVSGLAHALAPANNNRVATSLSSRGLVTPQALEISMEPGIGYGVIGKAGGGLVADQVQANTEFRFSMSFATDL